MARGKNKVSPEVAQRLVDLAREMRQSPSHSKSSPLKITIPVAHPFLRQLLAPTSSKPSGEMFHSLCRAT